MNSCVRNYQCFLPEIKHPPVKENVLFGGTGGDRNYERGGEECGLVAVLSRKH